MPIVKDFCIGYLRPSPPISTSHNLNALNVNKLLPVK